MAWDKLESGSKGQLLAVTMSEVVINASSKVLLFSDVSASASSMEIQAIRIEYVATSTAGTRDIKVEILAETGDDLHYEVLLILPTLTLSQSRNWQLARDLDETVASPAQYVQLPPGLQLFRGQKLRIQDSAAIDAAADDMVLHVMGKVHSRV